MQTGCWVLNFDSVSSKSTQSVFTQVFHFLIIQMDFKVNFGKLESKHFTDVFV